MFIGLGTVVNVCLVVVGGLLGLVVGRRFPEKTRTLVTQILGLFTLVIGASAIVSGLSAALTDEVGEYAPMLIVLGSLLVGGILGSLIKLEDRLDGAAEKLRKRVATKSESSTFVEGAVTSTLVFCVGPLAILGSISDGLGNGIHQLLVKSVMDGFAAIAFASSFGIGVVASIIPLVIYQGAWTLVGVFAGNIMTPGEIDALTATGGVILLGLGLRLAGVAHIKVGDLLPALLLAPIATAIVGAL
ncbi:MAG: DUF554 domain-containing protein [Propionibacteriaceae bacterium]|nr:DUF554 domain-containing protein [Propionibacteriaceae bacterium]